VEKNGPLDMEQMDKWTMRQISSEVFRIEDQFHCL